MAVHPPPQLPGTLRVAFEGTYGAATWANVMHFTVEELAAWNMADVNTLVDAIAAKYAAKLHHTAIVTGSHFSLVRAAYRELDDHQTFKTVRVVDYNGDEGVGGAPAQCAYLINWNSGDGRRGGKPRTYLCGVMAAAVVNDTDIAATQQTSLSTLANGFLGEVVGLGTANLKCSGLVDYSQRNANAWRDTAAIFEIFNGGCSPFLATIRNRVDRRR